MSSVMLNIVAERNKALKRVEMFENLFMTAKCNFKEVKDHKSDEGILHIKSCTHRKHPHARGRYVPECNIELCPWKEV